MLKILSEISTAVLLRYHGTVESAFRYRGNKNAVLFRNADNIWQMLQTGVPFFQTRVQVAQVFQKAKVISVNYLRNHI